jgi:hypothetical protein
VEEHDAILIESQTPVESQTPAMALTVPLNKATFCHINHPNLEKHESGCEELEPPDLKNDGGFCVL